MSRPKEVSRIRTTSFADSGARENKSPSVGGLRVSGTSFFFLSLSLFFLFVFWEGRTHFLEVGSWGVAALMKNVYSLPAGTVL